MNEEGIKIQKPQDTWNLERLFKDESRFQNVVGWLWDFFATQENDSDFTAFCH